MFHRIKIKTSKEHVLINLRNVINITLNEKVICYEANASDGIGAFAVFYLDTKKYYHTFDSIEEAKKEFDSLCDKVELR